MSDSFTPAAAASPTAPYNWDGDLAHFLETGDMTPAFASALDTDPVLQEKVEREIQKTFSAFEDLGNALKKSDEERKATTAAKAGFGLRVVSFLSHAFNRNDSEVGAARGAGRK